MRSAWNVSNPSNGIFVRHLPGTYHTETSNTALNYRFRKEKNTYTILKLKFIELY